MQTLDEKLKQKSEVTQAKKQDQPLVPNYSDEEIKFIGGLQIKLEQGQIQRDRVHDEFDGLTLAQYYDANEKGANTYIPPKKNKEDTNFVSGTIRQKLFSYLAYANSLDLSPSISAYDQKNLEIRGLGLSMEDIIRKTEELDEDDEKKMLRQYELLKQGTVFVEDIWEEKWGFEKQITSKFNGKIQSSKWDKRLKKIYERPTRNIIPMINVYLGSITTYDIQKQPYIFTVNYRPYYEAEGIYGNWERWKYVTKKVRPMVNGPTGQSSTDQQGRGMLYNNWRLTDCVEDMVEEVKFQDLPGYEYAVILNGVLMTPVGMPFPWNYHRYSITQQNLEPIHNFFAYGKSLVWKLRNNTDILDEMLRLAVLKTQKSFSPARFNLTGRILSSRIFMPGKMNYGINPGQLPIDPHESTGLTQSELAMIQDLKKNIDDLSVAPTFAGQGSKGDQTATEILNLQRQAQMVMGISVFALSLLEWKLSWLRLFNILQNWFNPIDNVVDEMRNQLVDVYRNVNVPATIEGAGLGRRISMVSKQQFTPQEVYDTEQQLTDKYQQPIRITVLNPDVVKSAQLVWQIVIIPRQKKSNEVSKVLFRGMMADLQYFGPTVNIPYVQQEFAEVWDRDPNKLFTKTPAPQQQPQQQGQNPVAPGIKIPGMPSPESAANQQIANQLKQ